MKHQQTAPVRIELAQAKEYNSRQYGIFFTINGFKKRRTADCLSNINAWALDLDEGTKQEQEQRIMHSPLVPSFIVESKRGFQVYWFAENATAENYKNITDKRLVPYFSADRRAKDLCRILRLPNFYHWKNKNDPFLVKIVYEQSVRYDEDFMLEAFPEEKKVSRSRGDVGENIAYSENEEALLKLSGAVELKGEQISFSKNSNGTQQICVNGERTSSWIDKQGFIGSYDRGGITVIQWVKWFGYNFRETMEILKKYGVEVKDV